MDYQNIESINKYGRRSFCYLLSEAPNGGFMSKNLIRKGEFLEILTDSESFDNLLSEKNEIADRILNYSKSQYFEFTRTPFETKFEKLQVIPEFEKVYDENGDIRKIEIITNSGHSKSFFDYKMDYIKKSGQKIINKSSLNDYQFESFILIFIYFSLCNSYEIKYTHFYDC
jgi:hypothetical protein